MKKNHFVVIFETVHSNETIRAISSVNWEGTTLLQTSRRQINAKSPNRKQKQKQTRAFAFHTRHSIVGLVQAPMRAGTSEFVRKRSISRVSSNL